ncbi:MAG: thioredoxin [Anaeromyxobacter sp.]
MDDQVIEVGAAEFQREVLEADRPVLVDFTAAWCAPCRALAPELEALAARHAGRLRVAQVDVDRHQVIADQYGIRSMPTLLLFRGGRVVKQLVGRVPRAKLEELVAG